MRLFCFRCVDGVRFVRFNRRKSQQAEREYEKVKHQLENLEESVRDRCKKEFTGKCSPGELRLQKDSRVLPVYFMSHVSCPQILLVMATY